MSALNISPEEFQSLAVRVTELATRCLRELLMLPSSPSVSGRLHVDGAYGALAAIANPDRLRGLALADSVSLDPPKWLYRPVDCSTLLYRSAAVARAAFSQTGECARTFAAGL